MEIGSPTEMEKEAAGRQAEQEQKEGERAGQRPTKKDREEDGGAEKNLQQAA